MKTPQAKSITFFCYNKDNVFKFDLITVADVFIFLFF